MQSLRHLNALNATLICSALLLQSATAQAQESRSGAPTIEEVLVTATKRVESALDVPISLETFQGDMIEQNSITNLDDLSVRVPNVTIGDGINQQTIYMRGMGSGTERSFEQSVALFVDDVYQPRSRMYRAPFFDMERVEVLRGPQAVLFGLNATAGTLNITTATTRPGDESFVRVRAGYEFEYEGFEASAVAGFGGEDMGLRIALRHRDEGDGFVFNNFTQQDEKSTEETVLRGTLNWAPSDNVEFLLKVNYSEADLDGEVGELFGTVPTAFGDDGELDWGTLSNPNLLGAGEDSDPGFDHDLTNVSARIDWTLDGGNVITGILGYAESDYHYVTNVGTLPVNTFASGIDETLEAASLELRIASPVDRVFSYIAGVYVANNEVTNWLPSIFGDFFFAPVFGPGSALRGDNTNEQDTDTISAFASGRYAIGDNLTATLGVRWSDVKKDYARDNLSCRLMADNGNGTFAVVTDLPQPVFAAFCGSLPGFSDKKSSDNFMPELIVQWDYSDDGMAYAKVGRSVKAGGFTFSGSAVADFIDYDDEKATGFEIGTKNVVMGGRATLSVTGFLTEFKDLQLNSFQLAEGGVVITTVRNAGKSDAKGFEGEFQVAASDWLNLGASIAFLDSEYTEFPNGPCFVGETPSDPATGACDKGGSDTPNAPKWTGHVYADFKVPVSSNLNITGGVTASFSDDYFTEGAIDPAAVQDSYTRWDARLGIVAGNDKWRVDLVGKNLSDEAINTFSQPFVGYIGYTNTPMTIGLFGTYNF